MSIAAAIPPSVEIGPTLYRLSVAQYHKMLEAGILRDGERVELLEGYLVNRMTHHPPSATVITRLQKLLSRRLSEEWEIRQQLPITTSDSEPEPDLAIVPGPDDRYGQGHPPAAEVVLVVEVADSSLSQDRNQQQRIYARSRIPIYWIVNIPDLQVEVYTQPRRGRNPTYRQRRDYRLGESVPLEIAGEGVGSLAVDDILPLSVRPGNQT
jgi:hypothetical protein